MSTHATPIEKLGRRLGRRVLCVGLDLKDVAAFIGAVDAELVLRAADAVDALPEDVVAGILDARELPADQLLLARRALRGVPVLVVGAHGLADADLDTLEATEVLRWPAAPGEARRRVASVLAQGRAALTASFAEQALGRSINGLSVADATFRDAKLVYVSPVFESMTGYRSDDVLGTNCRFLQGTERAQPGISVLRDAVEQRTHASAIVRNVRKDGTAFWNEVTIFPFEIHGRPSRWLGGVQHDVTEREEALKRIERLGALLVQQRAFAHRILDGIEVGIVTTMAEGTVTYMNQAAERLLDSSAEGSLPRTLAALLGLQSSASSLVGSDGRRSIVCAVGGRELDVLVTREGANDDPAAELFVTLRDRTIEQRAQVERQRVAHVLGMATMVAGFAHEIRNPIAAMRSLSEDIAELLEEQGLVLPHVPKLLTLVARIERLVRTTLAFGRPPDVHRERERPWTILSGALAGIVHRAPTSVTVEAAENLADVECDATRVVQALVILLDNALDAVGDPRRVTLRACGEARSVRFEVIDDGPGIAPEILDRVFDPFFTTKPASVGLGLAIAQQIAVENGARLEVTSRPGRTAMALVLGHAA